MLIDWSDCFVIGHAMYSNTLEFAISIGSFSIMLALYGCDFANEFLYEQFTLGNFKFVFENLLDFCLF